MSAVQDPEVSLEDKVIAFDNFEQLIESIDNANNLAALGLWSPLVQLLESPDAEIRRMAAWCVGTAVQNNPQSQEAALVVGAVPAIVKIALSKDEEAVRRKACYAISSEVRNYQPGADAVVQALPDALKAEFGKLDVADMEQIDKLIAVLRR